VKVLTGDNELVSATVCRQVGLTIDQVLLGSQIEAMNDADLALAAERHTLFAQAHHRCTRNASFEPCARTGISWASWATVSTTHPLCARLTSASRSTPRWTSPRKPRTSFLLEKSLLVLDDGVVEGRTTFCNMLKYIRMTASSNFGNVLSVLVASAFLPFLPMLPLQLLVQNLLYDISQTGIPFDNVDAQLVAKPLKWKPADIGRFMLFLRSDQFGVRHRHISR